MSGATAKMGRQVGVFQKQYFKAFAPQRKWLQVSERDCKISWRDVSDSAQATIVSIIQADAFSEDIKYCFMLEHIYSF